VASGAEHAPYWKADKGVGHGDELIAEHRRMTALVNILRQAGDRAAIEEFTDLLRRHVRKEENFLFEEMQRTLSREHLDNIGQHIMQG
jgi:hemerythrin-like domain-containing protein